MSELYTSHGPYTKALKVDATKGSFGQINTGNTTEPLYIAVYVYSSIIGYGRRKKNKRKRGRERHTQQIYSSACKKWNMFIINNKYNDYENRITPVLIYFLLTPCQDVYKTMVPPQEEFFDVFIL